MFRCKKNLLKVDPTPCLKQGVGSTFDWKPRLRNNKSHIKKKMRSCSIVNHFIDVCSDTVFLKKILDLL